VMAGREAVKKILDRINDGTQFIRKIRD